MTGRVGQPSSDSKVLVSQGPNAGRVGQVWRILDEDDREAGLVLVVESGPHNQPWPSWGVSAHRVEVLWELSPGWVAWNIDGDNDGRLFLVEGTDGVDTNAELVL